MKIGLSDVQAVLAENPELLGALDEYIKWRDATNTTISGNSETKSAGHGIKAVVAGLGKSK